MKLTKNPETSSDRKSRRVGTFTFGAVLILTGILMFIGMFWPSFDFLWLLKLSPLLFVSLGIEVLLSVRTHGKIRYDWVGMILCVILVLAALAFSAASRFLLYAPVFDGTRIGNEKSLLMEYWNFHQSEERQYLEFAKDEFLSADIQNQRGTISIELIPEDAENQESIYQREAITWEQLEIPVSEAGIYCLQITGNHAQGSARFQVSESNHISN